MQKKFLSVWPLALLQLVIVGNLQVLPANAIYGFSLPFLYLLAVITFFIPCLIMTSKLASTYPQTGGAYIWCEQAFGSRLGFFAVAILWFSNLLWYPSIFTLISANLAYLLNPALAQNQLFVIGFGLILFWLITGLNCVGVKPSTKISIWCSILGIILPILVIISCGLFWWLSGKPIAISLVTTPIIPNLEQFSHFSYLIAVVISLFGIEITAVHAGNVINPERNFPKSLIISSILLILLLLGAELAIAIILPPNKLNIETGLLDALTLFFQQTDLGSILKLILLLVFIGNVGSVTAWMLGSTRAMFIACQHNHVLPILQKVNRFEAPVGVLLIEAVVFTCASAVFLIFSQIVSTFWLLLVLASQVTLIYYIILFFSAIKLKVSWLLMGLGALTSAIALFIGFIPPSDLSVHEVFLFWVVMITGLLLSIILPFAFLKKKIIPKVAS